MKTILRTALAALSLAGIAITTASAGIIHSMDNFSNGVGSFSIQFATIGNAGNGNDTGAGGGIYSSPYGGVGYNYRIGVTEVPETWIGIAGIPVTTAWTGSSPSGNITWFQAAAFVNWLNTSTGHQAAYRINIQANSMGNWTPSDAGYDPTNLYRNKNAYYFLPSENEWFKAAFHKNDGVTANYWDYATGSNSIPTAVASGTTAGTAVYNARAVLAPADITLAGGLSAYGTIGQGGNVQEWLEGAFDGGNNQETENRTIRGGNFGGSDIDLRSSDRQANSPSNTNPGIGFRVASVIPEPSSTVLMCSASLLALARRRRATV